MWCFNSGLFAHIFCQVAMRGADLKKIEDLGGILEEHLIWDNRYSEHSTVGLAQQWDQLNQLGMRIKHNLEQQIQARNQSGVSEDALKEFSMMFRHFDKERTGRLDHNAFKSCLRALGYDLPMVKDGKSFTWGLSTKTTSQTLLVMTKFCENTVLIHP